MVEGHPLAVLSEADQAEPEVGFIPLSVEVQTYEGTTDPVGQPGAAKGVQERDPYHVAGQDEREAADRDGEPSGEAPEDRHEGCQGDDGAQASNEEREGVGDEELNVLGNALVRVVGLVCDELHTIVGAVGQPGAEVAFGEPAAPADLEHLIEIELVDREHDEHAHEPADPDELLAKHHRVLCLEGAEEVIVPLIQEDAQIDHPEREGHDHEQQPPSRPAILRKPVRADHFPCVGKSLAEATYGRAFRAMGGGQRNSARAHGGHGGGMLQLFRDRDHSTPKW